MINFGNNPDNILSPDQYINMYTGNTVSYEKYPYWNSATNAVNYSDSMSAPSLIGKNGPKICIYKPHPVINIQVVDDSGAQLRDYNNNVIPYVKLLLKFKPIY